MNIPLDGYPIFDADLVNPYYFHSSGTVPLNIVNNLEVHHETFFDWRCEYCGRLNPYSIYECFGCSSGKR